MKFNIGVRGHDISQSNIQDLAAKVRAEGFNHLQLALKKALPEYGSFHGRLSTGMMNHFREELAREGIRVSIFGCYINMGQPVDEKREREIEYFKEHIRFASDLGCKMVASEAGCYSEDKSFTELNYTEEAFERAVDTLKQLVAEAEKFGVIVAIEGVWSEIFNTPKKVRRVLDTINSNNLQIILDTVNYINGENYMEQDQIMRECFELFGDRINAIHLKDFVIVDGKREVATVGEGLLNFELLTRLIQEHKPHVEILIENYVPGTGRKVVEYMNKFVK